MNDDRKQDSIEDERPLTEEDVSEWEIAASSPGGARSAVLTVRFSPDELRRIRDVARATGRSMADVIRSAVSAALGGTTSIVTMGWGSSSGLIDVNVIARSGLVTRGQGLESARKAG